MGELMGSHKKDKRKKSKHKHHKRSQDAGGDACEVTKDRVRAHFLDGNTGPWAKDPKIGFKAFNARSETVIEKPMFRQAIKRRRCEIGRAHV